MKTVLTVLYCVMFYLVFFLSSAIAQDNWKTFNSSQTFPPFKEASFTIKYPPEFKRDDQLDISAARFVYNNVKNIAYIRYILKT
jgi:hypothetical protein